MEKFNRPKFNVIEESTSKSKCIVKVEPLERGFGITIGNSLRRILLSSIPGLSAYALKINGANHEFSTVEGVVEDVPSIILNIKKLAIKVSNVFKLNPDEKITLKIEGGKEKITGKDIICPAGISIINQDLLIARITKKDALKMEIFVRASRGFASFNDNKSRKSGLVGIIPIDSNFSPVKNVITKVEPTKVGQQKDLEKLILEVETNGCLTAKEAISISSKILMDHLNEFVSWTNKIEDLEIIDDSSEEISKVKLNLSIVELDLSVRALNSLKRYGIEKVEEVTQMTRQEVMAIKNMGKKSVDEIEDKLKEHGLSFKSE